MISVTTGRPVASRASASSLQPLLLQPLEAVGGGARLEGAAAQHVRAGRLDRRAVSMSCSRLSTEQGPAMTTKPSPPILTPPTSMTVGSGLDLAAGELVRLEDRHDLLDARERLQRLQARLAALVADGADDVALDAVDDVRLVAEVADPLEDLVELLFRGALAHDDDHGRSLYLNVKVGVKAKGLRGGRSALCRG